MKVLSIRQPWASLIAYDYKEYEFRSWRTKYRGELYIHASSQVEKENMEFFKDFGIPFETGKIIAKVNLDDVVEINEEFENSLIEKCPSVYGHSKGRGGYGWKVSNPILIKPIPVKGKLGIWNFSKSNYSDL